MNCESLHNRGIEFLSCSWDCALSFGCEIQLLSDCLGIELFLNLNSAWKSDSEPGLDYGHQMFIWSLAKLWTWTCAWRCEKVYDLKFEVRSQNFRHSPKKEAPTKLSRTRQTRQQACSPQICTLCQRLLEFLLYRALGVLFTPSCNEVGREGKPSRKELCC